MAVPSARVARRVVLQGALGSLALTGLSALTGCASSRTASGSGPELRPITAGSARQAVALSGAPNLAEVVAGMRTLGARLHRATASVGANWTVSPASIDVAFGMLRAGCRGSTARQIDAVFGYPIGSAPQGSAHAALNALTAHLVTTGPVATTPGPTPSGKQGPDPIVAVVNGLFLDRSFAGQVQHGFLQTLATQYGAGPTAVSFADPGAAATINAWVARQTRNRITRLFDQLDPATLLVLANAVYLKAAWLNQFSEAMTSPGPFTTSAGRVTAHLMRQQIQSVPYAAGAGWQRVSLPYVGNELTMRVVVPTRAATDLASLAPALAAATEPALADRRVSIDLILPRWDTATTLSLVPALTKLGMGEVFGAKADLSGIAAGLFVSDAIHRANVTVDERGTEAAAVTGIAVEMSAIAGGPAVVRVDRPFAWAVVHEPTGTPLFIGHVTNPVAA